MNKNYVFFAVLAMVGFYLYQRQQQQQNMLSLPAPTTSNPTGGTQVSGPPDVFGQVLGFLTEASKTVNTIAQQSTRSN